MAKQNVTISFVRRGHSESGGAEAYLKRLGKGMAERGYLTRLYASPDWPATDSPFGEIIRVPGNTPLAFANELDRIRTEPKTDLLISLERVCRCDIYRAGDGVHQAWLDRRQKFELPGRALVRKFQPKHNDLLRLERALLDERGAERVITNSRMVKNEIIDVYNYRRDKIDVVPNGIPLAQFGYDPAVRDKSRSRLNLEQDEIAVLFVGSGWERKGLRYAVKAVEQCEDLKVVLLVAGRGSQAHYRSGKARFLGEVQDLRPIYAAADIFILPTIYDPFSNACLEALASGLPVITTRANGFSEIMEDRIHGSLVDEPNDVADLRKAIEVWSDATRRTVARPSILKRAAQFDISKNIEKTLQILLQFAASAAST